MKIFFSILFCFFSSFLLAQSVPAPIITRDGNGKPNWVDRPDNAFNKAYYVAAVGYGNNRGQADANAFANLTGLFGQSVNSHISDMETYKERIVDGKIEVVSTQDAMQAVELSSSMDSLIGAEISDRWEDRSKNVFYAVAVMEKAKSIRIYSDLLNSNIRYINTILSIPDAEQVSFDDISRQQLAGSMADTNELSATVISVLGGPDRRAELKSGDDYRYEAVNLARRIPISIVVQNDSSGKVQAAFTGVFTTAGFRTRNNNSRYVLDVNVSLVPADFTNQNFKYTRYTVDANLRDTKTNSIIIPFNISGREGHTTQPEADLRAIRAIEEEIKVKYPAVLNSYVSSALPNQ